MTRSRNRTALWAMPLAICLGWSAAALKAQCPAPALVPPFEGTGGGIIGGATGVVPDGWRAFAVGGGAAALEIVPVAADELYPGSAATQAVRFAVTDFTGDQALDHDPRRFIMSSAMRYHAEFYIRTGNADESAQQYRFGYPVFDQSGAFLLREPGSPIDTGSPASTATSSWRRVRARSFMDIDAVYAHISFRLTNDGGAENAILIALPSVTASPDPIANPAFDMTLGGFREGGGNIVGNVPDDWRAFAVGGAVVTTNIVDVAADELYPGSAATKAALVQIDTYGVDQGFDLDLARFQMFPGVTYQGSAYVKSANPDNSSQNFRLQFPIYGGPAYQRDPAFSPFLGREPGSSGTLTATSTWQRLTGPMFQDSAALSGALAFRVTNDGGAGNAILIAMPSAKSETSANLVPNPSFLGTAGTAVGAVTGAVPDQWRAVAVTGTGGPPVLGNPGFEVDPEGTTTPAGDFILAGTVINGWRTFSVGGAGGKMTVTAAAGTSGNGVEIVRENAAGDSALDLDSAGLRVLIPPQQRVYKLMVDGRDGGVYGGTPLLSTGLQFQTTSLNRGVSVDPTAVFEVLGTTAVSDTNGWLSARVDVGAGAGRSAYVDNVRITDVTSGADRMINPGFEASNTRLLHYRFFLAGAAVGSASISNDAHSGTNAALLEVTEDTGETDRDCGLDLLSNLVAVRAGENVEIRFFAKKVSGAATRLSVNVAAHLSNGAYASTIVGPLVDPAGDAYQEFVVDATIPAGATRLNVGFRIMDENGVRTVGSYLIDDLTVTGLTPIDPFAPSAAQIAISPLAAGALFAGSPATNAVQWRQTLFGSNDALLDHLSFPFPVMKGRDYKASIYVKTANSDAADQVFDVIMQLREAGATVQTLTAPAMANGTWQKLEIGGIQSLEADSGLVRLRLSNDGGADNAILIALPTVELQEPADGLIPNSIFAGNDGSVEGAATGEVPDRWRIFAVAGAAAEASIAPVAAGELFAGSPAVNAVTFRRTVFEGDAGFDTHLARHPLTPNTPYRVSVYARTANSDSSTQTFSFGHPVFVQGATFLGRGPGSFDATAESGWQLFSGPIFTDVIADTGHVALRINGQDGADDAVMLALPAVELACPTVSSIAPVSAGTGQVLSGVVITGTNFFEGLSVRLVQAGQPDIVGSSMLITDEQSLTVTFDLAGAAGGQWDVVVCAGGDCAAGELIGGFTIAGCNTPFADADGDGDVDQNDFAGFQSCITLAGDPSGAFDSTACGCFDRDGDQDVDHDDFVPFFLCGSGPAIPADENCGN
jgi:hypothetical protein